KGNLREAQTKLEMAIRLKKESSAAHASLGSLLAEVGNNQQALKHLTTALKLRPSASVHSLMGSVYYAKEKHKRAIQHLKQATKLDPQFGEAHYQLGLLCLEMNWLRKAQECFKTAQALNPRETRYRKRVRSFSEDATGPDQLNTLIREELLLLNQSGPKRTKCRHETQKRGDTEEAAVNTRVTAAFSVPLCPHVSCHRTRKEAMAEERTEKSRALDLAVSQIEKQFGKGSIMRL